MKIFLTDQTKRFHKHLEDEKQKPVMRYDKAQLKEKITSIPVKTNKDLEQLNLDFLFSYQIFPGHIMQFQTQWQAEKRNMRKGDTIVQQVYLPPFRKFSQKIIFGVRISEVIDEPTRKGFSYETLEGHVEQGISTFTFEEYNGEIVFNIHTFSRPGNFLTRLLGPAFSVPYQTYCTHQALSYVKHQVEHPLLKWKPAAYESLLTHPAILIPSAITLAGLYMTVTSTSSTGNFIHGRTGTVPAHIDINGPAVLLIGLFFFIAMAFPVKPK